MSTDVMARALTPCECRLSREAAMGCPRESRGTLLWSPTSEGPNPTGPIEAVAPDGRREVLTFGHDWIHFDERIARDHAAIRHLDFEVR